MLRWRLTPRKKPTIFIIICVLVVQQVKNSDSEIDKFKFLTKVIEIFSSHQVPILLVDKLILSKNEDDILSKIRVGDIDHGSHPLEFAVLSHYVNEDKMKVFQDILINEGGDVIIVKDNDPWSVGVKSSIVSHVLIDFGTSFNMKLIVYYERLSWYWWNFDDESNCNGAACFRVRNVVPVKKLPMGNVFLYIPRMTDEGRFIPCNYTRAMNFYSTNIVDTSHAAEKFKSVAYSLLTKAKMILDKLEIPFWISSGTCLGYFRQCDIITYSKDVDIGIFIDDYKPELIPKFTSGGLKLIHLFGKQEDSFELSFKFQNVKLDIFFFYKEEEYYWNGGVEARTGQKFKYIFPKFNLCWTEFLRLKIRIPCETLDYIKANYGNDWFIPVEEWDWKSSPPNVRRNGMWPRELFQEVIQTHHSQCLIF